MNNYPWTNKAAALVAIAAGILLCFWGYRILKISLGIIGLIIGGGAGWEIGIALFHASQGMALLCAACGAVAGIVLCVWLYFLGIFLIGAGAGTVVAAAFFNGTGHPTQPIIFLACAIIFGLIALVAQKLMIVVSTALSGSYLLIAGIWPFVGGGRGASVVWLQPAQGGGPLGAMGYAALGVWVLLALMGMSFQFRRRKVEVTERQP